MNWCFPKVFDTLSEISHTPELFCSGELPTPAGHVTLKVPAGTHAGQKLRLSKRGLSRPDGTTGDLYAVAQIAVPTVVDDRQRALFQQLQDASTFNPRAHMVD